VDKSAWTPAEIVGVFGSEKFIVPNLDKLQLPMPIYFYECSNISILMDNIADP
jgi:hypothetical protein